MKNYKEEMLSIRNQLVDQVYGVLPDLPGMIDDDIVERVNKISEKKCTIETIGFDDCTEDCIFLMDVYNEWLPDEEFQGSDNIEDIDPYIKKWSKQYETEKQKEKHND